jgi:hypothetical protein
MAISALTDLTEDGSSAPLQLNTKNPQTTRLRAGVPENRHFGYPDKLDPEQQGGHDPSLAGSRGAIAAAKGGKLATQDYRFSIGI